MNTTAPGGRTTFPHRSRNGCPPSSRPRRLPHSLLTILLFLSLLSPIAAAQPPRAIEDSLLELTNVTRVSHRVRPLEFDAGLARAALAHAQEMARLGYFAHESPVPEHASLKHRLTVAGVPSTTAGENLVRLKGNFDVAQASIDSWLESPGHRENLLRSDFTHVGFGLSTAADGTIYVAQVLATQPRDLLSVSVEPVSRNLVEVQFVYEGASAELAVFVDGEHYRDASLGNGTLRFRLPAGQTQTIAVGEVHGNIMLPFDSFTLITNGGVPRLLAGDGVASR